MTTTLDRSPSAMSLYLKAAASARRRPGAIKTLPPLSLAQRGLRADPQRLADYCQLCGMAPSAVLPISFPQVVATSLHMALMTQAKFPLPLLGLVHVANRIEQAAPIAADAVFDIEVRVGDCRQVRAGLEFDLLTELRVEEAVAWKAVTTIIHRQPWAEDSRGPRPPAAPEASPLAAYQSFAVPADTGRRYARISGDYNPIHLYAATAKLFGFPRAIAHGMWSLARCLGALEAQLATPPQQLDVQFKQPLLLPGRVALKSVLRDGGIDFWLLAARGGKVHLGGRLR
jgi:acyl dehydratase